MNVAIRSKSAYPQTTLETYSVANQDLGAHGTDHAWDVRHDKTNSEVVHDDEVQSKRFF